MRYGFAWRPVTGVAVALAVVLTALSGRYGFHRDELYFLVAGRHPAWGYVDQPPLTPLLARVSTAVFGESPAGLRVVATLATAAVVVLVALIARELCGGRRAQILAAICAAVSGYLLAVGHMVSTATFDLLAWILLSWLGLRLLRTRDGRYWLPIGAVAGLAMLNKSLVLLVVVALLAGVLVTGPREVLRSRWLVAGAALAALVMLPNLIWQARHDWPQLTVAGGISSDDGTENRILFVPMQLMQLSPLLVPVWVAGWLRLWRRPELRWARSYAVAYPVLAVLVFATGGKPYYALPLLLVLTAAGCEPLARWGRTPIVAAGAALALVTSALVTLPVLPVSALGAVTPINPEQGEQVGWPQLADAVAAGWSQIPAADRDRAVVFTTNYGEAGAVDRYGPERGLPTPYSGHMSFADWGPPPADKNGPVLLVVYPDPGARTGLLRHFTGCRDVAKVDNGHDVDNEEQGAQIVLCDGPLTPWAQLWPDLRRFY
jgi:hypothetical protein